MVGWQIVDFQKIMKYDLVEKEIVDYYLQVDSGNPGAKTALYDCISMIQIGESRSKINYMGFNSEPYLSYIDLSFIWIF